MFKPSATFATVFRKVFQEKIGPSVTLDLQNERSRFVFIYYQTLQRVHFLCRQFMHSIQPSFCMKSGPWYDMSFKRKPKFKDLWLSTTSRLVNCPMAWCSKWKSFSTRPIDVAFPVKTQRFDFLGFSKSCVLPPMRQKNGDYQFASCVTQDSFVRDSKWWVSSFILFFIFSKRVSSKLTILHHMSVCLWKEEESKWNQMERKWRRWRKEWHQ